MPQLWRDERTPHRERKRLVRLLIADVTLRKGAAITAQLRFTGGATTTLEIALPLPASEVRHTDPALVAEIDRLLEQYTDGEVAARLNAAGQHSYEGKPFHRLLIGHLRGSHQLADHYSRVRARGLLTGWELAQQLNVTVDTLERWRDRGLVQGERANDKGGWLYYVPTVPLPAKWKHKPQAAQVTPETSDGGAV